MRIRSVGLCEQASDVAMFRAALPSFRRAEGASDKLELEHEARSTELGVNDGLSAPPFRAALHIRRGLWIAVASSA